MRAIAQALEPIVGDSGIYDWETLPPDWQERLARASLPDPSPPLVVYPSTIEELARVVNLAYTHGWSVLPCGRGSKLGWGGVGTEVDFILSTERLNRIIDHAVGDLTVTAEAGVKLADLQGMLAQTEQFLPLDPTYPREATLGGIIATADTGSWRQRYGSVRDMLLGISFVRYDGQIAKAGGRVVKNVAGYDLMKLFAGSYGTLGILAQVTFRTYPIPEASRTVVLTGETEAIASAAKILRASALTPTAADLLSPQLVAQLGVGQGMGLMVRFQSVAESVREQSARLLEVGQQLGLQGTQHDDAEAAPLWQALRETIWNASDREAIACKIGVIPAAAIATLTQFDAISSSAGVGLIHAGSGLGRWRFDPEAVTPQTILNLRRHCESCGGFLTVLEAPISLKQQLDVWGYTGNALKLMRQIKQKFDPKNILSPHRFVGGI
jgi:glycolate oxidase FAD binding subunit